MEAIVAIPLHPRSQDLRSEQVATTAAAARPAELELAWVERAQAGDRRGHREFIRRYQRPVGSLLRRMLGPAGLDHLVEDVAQETFLRALRALPRFEVAGPARLSTWLLRIASRLAINELTRRRLDLEPIDAGGGTELAGEAEADAHERRGRIARSIQAAVAELPPEFRAAFLLREYHGLDYTEIAEALELELGTVKSRLSRARQALRERLEEVRDV